MTSFEEKLIDLKHFAKIKHSVHESILIFYLYLQPLLNYYLNRKLMLQIVYWMTPIVNIHINNYYQFLFFKAITIRLSFTSAFND
jgi:hypothetical protein